MGRSRRTKIGLGQGGQSLLDFDRTPALSGSRNQTHNDWVRVTDACEKFSHQLKKFYKKRYPGCEVTVSVPHSENVEFSCDMALSIYFRVQARGAGWPEDTLVIANIYSVRGLEPKAKLLELFELLMMAQSDVGFFNLGVEFAGKVEAPLIEEFGFEKLEGVEDCWTISMVELRCRIDAGAVCR